MADIQTRIALGRMSADIKRLELELKTKRKTLKALQARYGLDKDNQPIGGIEPPVTVDDCEMSSAEITAAEELADAEFEAENVSILGHDIEADG